MSNTLICSFFTVGSLKQLFRVVEMAQLAERLSAWFFVLLNVLETCNQHIT